MTDMSKIFVHLLVALTVALLLIAFICPPISGLRAFFFAMAAVFMVISIVIVEATRSN